MNPCGLECCNGGAAGCESLVLFEDRRSLFLETVSLPALALFVGREFQQFIGG